MIARRHVFFLAGYDPYDLRAQHARFKREAAKFEKTWGVKAEISDLSGASGEVGEHWRMTTRGPNWIVSTLYEPLDWHDVVAADLAGPAVPRLFHGFTTFLDFVFSGAAFRYFRASWRYGLFFLMPFFYLLAFAAAGVAAGVVLANAVTTNIVTAGLTIMSVAAAFFAILIYAFGKRWHINQALDDWIFARDFMYGRRRDVEQRLDAFAGRIVAAAQRGNTDEILIVGHSLGATMAVEAIARALDQDADFASRGLKVSLLTIGATIPKLALHPAAKKLRDCMARIVSVRAIFWTEYQARRDPISFYKFDPFALLPLLNNEAEGRPCIRLVGIKDMLSAETFERIKLHHMRLHYQFVMANERRALYDYFMLLVGPGSCQFVSTLPAGMLDAYGEDGSFNTPGKVHS